MSVVAVKDNGYAGAAYPNEGSLFLRPKNVVAGAAPGIICLHGHGGSCLQFAPFANKASVGYFANLLALEGFNVLAIDAFGATAWGNADEMAVIDAAYAWLTGSLGAEPGEIGLMGWSMGGLGALNWIKRNAAKVGAAWLWAPVTDLDWAEAQPGWTAEIDAAYNPYATASVGYRIHDEYASWRLGIPIRVAHADDDGTIPVAQSQAFVDGVADPEVTFRAIATGGHTQLFSAVGDAELVDHFRGALKEGYR